MATPKSYAIVADGVVINVIWVQPNQAKEFKAILLDNPDAGIGWRYADGVFSPPDISEELE